MSLTRLTTEVRPSTPVTATAAPVLGTLTETTVQTTPATTGAQTSLSNQVIDSLTKFIPTEVLAPYVAALSLVETNQVTWSGNGVFWVFVAITPAAFLLFYLAKIALDPTKQMPGADQVPFLAWRMFAATIAFAVWALAVPTNDAQSLVGGAGVAGFLAFTISPVLSAVDVIIGRYLQR